MTVAEAKSIIHWEQTAPFGRLLLAASVLASKNNSKAVKYVDLVECLRRGNSHGKLTAVSEIAALALYARTSRERRSPVAYEDFDVNPESWESYLKTNNIL
jgi:hypothetical protein